VHVPIAKPNFGEEEQSAVRKVLASGRLIQGEWVARFETAFAELHGARFGVATANGTLALSAALLAHGIGPGDEVIVPSFSFFATASSVLSVGARPVFADIDADTFCLSPPHAAEIITSATRAILPVHLFGHLAPMDELGALCEDRELVLIEDAAQAHLATDRGRMAGYWGSAAFSFHASKNMTTGEGGMVLTNDERIAERLRQLRNQGRSGSQVHETVGYNYRMTNLAAAIGLAQIARLEALTSTRIANAARLDANLELVTSPRRRAECRHVYQQYTVRVPESVDRDAVVKHLNRRGVEARVYYACPIHRQPAMADLATSTPLPVTEQAAREVFSLPVHPQLSEAELDYVITETNAAVRTKS
jgi:dTDP-4-amino-4,6-dideoxygalactose transaminase